MATGDITWFDQALADIANKVHNIDGDSIKFGLITTSTTPAATTANPCWGAGGSTNMSTNAVATGTAWTGPIDLNVTCALTGGLAKIAGDNVSIAQDAGGFTNARWGVFYNDTQAAKKCLAYVDLGSDRSIVTGPLAINWAAGGILTIDQA